MANYRTGIMHATRKTIYIDYSLKTEQGMLKTDIRHIKIN